MELTDIKEAKTWAIGDIETAINERKKVIDNLESDLKKLREIKLQKMFEAIKPQVLENKIDLSLDDLQQLLLGKNDAESDNKISKQKNKSSRSKKKADDDKTDDDDETGAPEKNAQEKISQSDVTDDAANENKPAEEKTPTEGNSSTAQTSENGSASKTADVVSNNSATYVTSPEEIAAAMGAIVVNKNSETSPEDNSSTQHKVNANGNNVDLLNNPAEEIFEEVKVKSEKQKNLQTVAQGLGLPKDATFAEVKKAFEAGGKNNVPQPLAAAYEQMLGEIERGEIV